MSNEAAPHVSGYYLDLLARIHREMRPRTYLEIGVHTGESMTLVQPETLALGIDPVASIRRPINSTAKLFFERSDDFFARHDVRAELGGRPVDLAFIDGMHLFEYALRDFRNVERWCGPDSVVLVHDCYPRAAEHAARRRSTREWTGDTWKLVPCLKEYRPDLDVAVIRVGGTGLAMIRNLDSDQDHGPLHSKYDEIMDHFRAFDFARIEAHRDAVLNSVPNDWDVVASMLPRGPLAVAGTPRATRRRRVNARIALHQAKRVAKLAASRGLGRRAPSSEAT